MNPTNTVSEMDPAISAGLTLLEELLSVPKLSALRLEAMLKTASNGDVTRRDHDFLQTTILPRETPEQMEVRLVMNRASDAPDNGPWEIALSFNAPVLRYDLPRKLFMFCALTIVGMRNTFLDEVEIDENFEGPGPALVTIYAHAHLGTVSFERVSKTD